MSNTAGDSVQKVTEKIEGGSDEIIETLAKAVRSIHGHRDADLEQEAFLRTLTAFRKTPAISHPDAFMWKIVRDTVADHWRRKKRRNDTSWVGKHDAAGRADPEAAIDRKRRLEFLHAAIFRLGCDVRGPVYLFYVEDYSIPDIARACRKSESAVKMALHRGRRRLEELCRRSAIK